MGWTERGRERAKREKEARKEGSIAKGGGGEHSRMDGYRIEESVSKCNPRTVISSSIWFQCSRNTKDIKFYSLSEAPVKDETPRSVQRINIKTFNKRRCGVFLGCFFSNTVF